MLFYDIRETLRTKLGDPNPNKNARGLPSIVPSEPDKHDAYLADVLLGPELHLGRHRLDHSAFDNGCFVPKEQHHILP